MINNTALRHGGALSLSLNVESYLSNRHYLDLRKHYQLLSLWSFGYAPTGIVFNFIGNSANDGGNALYGVYLGNSYFIHFSPSFSEDPSLVSSDPVQFCFCKQNLVDCFLVLPTHMVYPGEIFEVSGVVVGAMNGLVTSSVHADIYNQSPYSSIEFELGDLQYVQSSNKRNCTNFKYSIFTNNTSTFNAFIDFTDGVERLHQIVSISVQRCPLGFTLSNKTRHCDCVQPLHDIGTVTCNISGRSIQRRRTTWIGVLGSTNSTSVIFSTTCPFSYCIESNVTISVIHLNQDEQCSDDRSGILCGGCRANYSLVLGSNRCLPNCTNNSLSLFVAFAAAGMALVFFIKILNLTVSQGTLNGLIFYANIIGAQPTLVFPTGGSQTTRGMSTLLSVFIAWLNLDLGIETCFFDGMDAYTKAWLQFVFPVYIWMIAIVIIAFSRYSMLASRLFGNNSVPVLATLVFLSYSKLLRAVISSLSVSYFQFLDGTKISVWERDGNVYYLSGKHIPLFVLALGVLLLLLFPFTLVLTSIQWLNRGTHLRVLRWVTKLKPFFDAFTGSLHVKHHYWMGILLLFRCILLLIIFTYTSNGDSMAYVAISFAVILILAVPGLKYRSLFLISLENSYIMNLGLLFIVTGYQKVISFSDNQEMVVMLSVGIAFLQFIATAVFHTYTQLKKPVKNVIISLKKIRAKRRNYYELEDAAAGDELAGDNSDTEQDSYDEQHPLILPTMTEIHLPPHEDDSEFREPLLEYLSDED